MSQKSNQTNSASAQENPGDNEVRLSDIMFVEYVEMNLEEVVSDVRRVRKESELNPIWSCPCRKPVLHACKSSLRVSRS